jgi:hypothetical protein
MISIYWVKINTNTQGLLDASTEVGPAERWLITLMIEAASTCETSVNFYQTTRRNNPEDSHIHTRRRENLISHEGCQFDWMDWQYVPADWFVVT